MNHRKVSTVKMIFMKNLLLVFFLIIGCGSTQETTDLLKGDIKLALDVSNNPVDSYDTLKGEGFYEASGNLKPCKISTDCDDGLPCTKDMCNSSGYCEYEILGKVECDGNLCTKGDYCNDKGECIGGTEVKCPDSDPQDCFYKVCNPSNGECDQTMFEPQGKPCSDGNPCTDNDMCNDHGVCVGGMEHVCLSTEKCQTAWCNKLAVEGTNPCIIEYLPEGTPCDDGSKCTDEDKCIDTEGLGRTECIGKPIDCSDGNDCTLDTCFNDKGCVYEAKSDGTLCQSSTDKCGSKYTCQKGQCVPQEGIGCNDGILCTTDICGENGCEYVPNDNICDDGDPCTIDKCLPNVGCKSTPMSCPPGEICKNGKCVSGCTPIDGGWSDWVCGPCIGATFCQSGIKECKRTCNNPPPSCGGKECVGEDFEIQSCGLFASQIIPLEAGTHSYDKCGQVISGNIPFGKTQVVISLWGGGGGGGAPGPGGGGAFVSGVVKVSQGDKIEVRVGCGGAAKNGGGGASYVFKNDVVIMVAAGGGGGGSDGCSGCSANTEGVFAGAGGGGGAVNGSGQPGNPNNDLKCNAGGGGGGSQTTGGAGGKINDQSIYSTCTIDGYAGSANKGGANHLGACAIGYAAEYEKGGCSGCGNGCGGGGGSGYYGGGSGSAKWTYVGGGGGGGSSYADPNHVININSEGGNGQIPGGQSQFGYNGNAGMGGQGCTAPFDPNKQATAGKDGQVIISL